MGWLTLLILTGTVIQASAIYRYRCYQRELHAWFFMAGFIGLFCLPLMLVMLGDTVFGGDSFNPKHEVWLIVLTTIWLGSLLFASVGLFHNPQPRPQAQSPARPVSTVPSSARLLSLDLIRGVAILGILLLNIYAFAMPPEASMVLNWRQGQYSAVDMWLFQLENWLFLGRFLTLFSLLFGVSLYLLWQRSPELLTRRLYWLMLLGALHLCFWWWGDILLTYAVTGWLLLRYGLLQLDVAGLWRTAHRFLAIAVALPLLGVLAVVFDPAGYTEDGFTLQELAQARADWTGSYSSQLLQLLEMAQSQLWMYLLHTGWFVAALMLYGMALYRGGWFFHGFSGRKTLALFLLGSGLSGLNALAHHLTDYRFSALVFNPLDLFACLLIALSYGSMLIRLANKAANKVLVNGQPSRDLLHRLSGWLLRWILPCGRLALSLYLLQSISMVLLFRFIAPHWFAELELWQLTAIALLAIVLQVLGCRLYLSFFKQGPAEWLWRKLTLAPVNGGVS